MEKNIEGDEQLDYLDKTLESRRNFRAVSFDHRSLMIKHIACFNGRIPVDRATAVRGYHVYGKVQVPTVDEEFNGLQ